MSNKIIVHACGGAGINISDKALNSVGELGSGFAELKFSYVDTSRANIGKINPRGEFWLVESESHLKNTIEGSGGERRSNSSDIVSSANKYLDARGIKNKVTGEFHVVVFSASGGSGSVVGPMILKNLLERNIPAFAIVVGDSSSVASTKFTLNTMATLSSISNITKKAINIVYCNNASLNDKKDIIDAEKKANSLIFNTMACVSLFLSGDNEAIDYQDMANMINQTNYSSVTIQPGLYGLLISKGQPNLPENSIPVGIRSLTIPSVGCDVEGLFLHSKKGYVTDQNALNVFDGKLPVHMVSYANFFDIENAALKKDVEHYEEIMRNMRVSGVSGTTDAIVDESTGLVM